MKLKDIQFEKKFEELFENTINRYQNGGYLAGDIVKIKKDALKHPYVVGMSIPYQEMVRNAIETDLNLRLSAVRSIRPGTSGNMSAPATDSPADFYADIVVEYAPGLWRDPITLPLEVLELVDTEGNLAPVPDSLKRKSISTKPEKVVTNDKDRSNPVADTKLANNKNAKDGRDQADKPKPYKESIGIMEAYENVYKKKLTTDDVNDIIQSMGPDYEPDWRDNQEVEIHNFPRDDNRVDSLITALEQNGISVTNWDFRYEETLRLNFADEYEDADYSDQEIKTPDWGNDNASFYG